MPPFEEIDHTADRAFRVRATSREGLFQDAAKALYSLGAVILSGAPGGKKEFSFQADDIEGLLIQWLNELLFLLEYDRMAVREVRIEHLTDTVLRASGQAAQVLAVGKNIKAATYSGMRILERDGTWETTVVVDV
jgi:SHS2 domain-containing protein